MRNYLIRDRSIVNEGWLARVLRSFWGLRSPGQARDEE